MSGVKARETFIRLDLGMQKEYLLVNHTHGWSVEYEWVFVTVKQADSEAPILKGPEWGWSSFSQLVLAVVLWVLIFDAEGCYWVYSVLLFVTVQSMTNC